MNAANAFTVTTKINGAAFGPSLFLFVCLLAAAPAPAAHAVPPPPPSGVQIECGRTTYASEQMICSDPALMAQDAQMMAVYWRALASTPHGERPAFEQHQKAWMRERNRCALEDDGRACVLRRYAQREAELGARLAPPRDESLDAKVAGTGFHAVGTVRCGRKADKTLGECRAGVVRATDGSANVKVFWPNGAVRMIFFGVDHKAVESDASGAWPETVRDGDVTRIRIGDEQYEIPDALPYGG